MKECGSSLLQNDACTISDQIKIRETVYDNEAFALLNYIWEYRERGRETRVAVGEYVDIGAFGPVSGSGRVDRSFDVRASKVHGSLGLGKRSPLKTFLRSRKKRKEE